MHGGATGKTNSVLPVWSHGAIYPQQHHGDQQEAEDAAGVCLGERAEMEAVASTSAGQGVSSNR